MERAIFRVGIDVGGTFTDVAAYETASGQLISFKIPSTPGQLAGGVVAAVAHLGTLAPGAALADVIHGTTVATNALIEGRGAPTALVTTAGFRDVLEIARQSRLHLYHPRDPDRPLPLVPRRRRFEVQERVNIRGEVLVPLRVDALPALVEQVRATGAVAVAVCLLHSYRYAEHERLLKSVLGEAFPHVSISSEINAEFREYERTNTTVVNATLMPLVRDYVRYLERELGSQGLGGRLHIVQSNGGMMTSGTAQHKPINTIMSGPAAGVAAARHLMRRLGLPNAVTFDMGGTSTDVCVIHQGQATITAERQIAGQPVRLSSVNIESIGAGGGSLAWTDDVGALKVGPQSAGASPGPACYGQGGTEATVTDANLVLGYLAPEGVWGGSIRVQPRLAVDAVARVGERFGLPLRRAAEGIVDIANSNMLRALRLVSVQRGFDLRDFVLVPFGGAGPVHAGRLARELNVRRVVVPVLSGVFSAYGCLVSELRYDRVQTFFSRLDRETPATLAAAFRAVERQALDELHAEGYAPEAVHLRRSLDLRYVGQTYELEVPLVAPPDGLDPQRIRRAFDALHEQQYAYATAQPVECVNLRLSATIPTAVPEPSPLPDGRPGRALVGRRRASFKECGAIDVAVYERTCLAPGEELRGPAVVEEAWSTTVVYPGQVLTVDRYGNLHITVQ
ncbi:MAG: hydantoinase/oxoprolinase family protein [Chloroflexi bacterium]|nr:hydantoinase/oxoprolinase family protein [Chloroflexota bacterium]MBI4504323.1 hydantoinase/oxoprolinase family protein [Chloroflexota bacterium]